MPFRNLNRDLDRSNRKNLYAKKKNHKKRFLKIIIILVVLAALIYLPVRGAYQSTKSIISSSKGASQAFKDNNLDEMKRHVKDMKGSTDSLNLSLNFLIWLRIIPFVGGYYADIHHFASAAGYELKAAETVLNSLEPYKAELGFNGQPQPGQDKVGQFVKILDKIIPNLDKIQPDLKKASDEVASIDVSKYPENFGKYRLRSQVDTAKNFISGAYYAISQGRPAIEIAPDALGVNSPKTYLLIFQNDKEIRATGGFMTAYAFMTFDKGKITSSQSDDIYRLDEKLLTVCLNVICPLTPPAPIVKYLPEVNGKPRTAWSMRDSNLSPDVPTSLKTFERMYGFLSDAQKFDGIILIDTHVVEELIKITGPIEVFGTKYSADTDKRCNCPNVIYELEAYAQIIEKGEKDRKAILGQLMQQILARSLGSATDKLPEFINAGVQLANQKHMIFYMHDQKTEDALFKLGWTGNILQTSGDYLTINDSNFAGGKSNLYVTQEVTLDIDPKSGKHKLSIQYKNPQPYNIWLNGINRDYVRIYVPKGSKLISSKGSQDKVNTIEDELGKTVFDAFIQVRPQNSLTLSFEYETPQITQKDGKYPLLIQKQPGTKDFPYTIKINGSQKESFKLDIDKNLSL